MSCILITGMHRSGTSMMAGLLANAGVWYGDQQELMVADVHNETGYHERKDVMRINESLLGWSECSWDKVRGYKSVFCPHEDARIERLMARIGEHPVFGLKDPRFCLTYEAWRPHMPVNTKIIAMVRHPVCVAKSLWLAQGTPEERGMELWRAYNRSLLSWVHNADALFVDYDASLAFWREAASKVGEFTGIVGLRPQHLNKKYRHHYGQKYALENLDKTTLDLWADLQRRCDIAYTGVR